MPEAQTIFIFISLILCSFLAVLAFYLWRFKKRLNQSQETIAQLNINEKQLREEVSEYKDKITQQVLHDAVTGLPSISVFKDQVQNIINQSKRYNSIFGILFLNLKNFKVVNNTLGYDIGDAVLKEVAERLRLCLRQIDMACRFSGDTFVILLSQLVHPESAGLVAHRLLQSLDEPFRIERHELSFPINVGIAIYPIDGKDVETLLRNAANALSQSRNAGIQRYQFYHAEMYNQSRRELTLNSDLSRDIIFQQLIIHYQPQFNVEENEIFCWDAQLRWHHPALGLINEHEFAQLAENNRRIAAINDWLLLRVCHQLQLWHTQGYALLSVLVNVSIHQLENPHFISTLLRILQETQVYPKQLMFEISETDMLKESEVIEKAFSMFSKLGVQIVVNHFGGSGDALLQHLKQFPIHYLKISSSFIRDIVKNPESEAIVKTMIMLANNLNKPVIATGVKTQEQKQLLQKLGCFLMQGDFFSPPLNELEVVKKLTVKTTIQEDELELS